MLTVWTMFALIQIHDLLFANLNFPSIHRVDKTKWVNVIFFRQYNFQETLINSSIDLTNENIFIGYYELALNVDIKVWRCTL